jgi:hypothetical protein
MRSGHISRANGFSAPDASVLGIETFISSLGETNKNQILKNMIANA